MMVNEFLQRVKSGQAVQFQETIAVIAEHYQYQPTEFSNGLQQPLVNDPGCTRALARFLHSPNCNN